MNEMTIEYFNDTEEEFVNLLMKTGTRQNVARLLIFLAKTPSASSRDIEYGTGLRQSEISVGMKYLLEQKWIDSWENREKNKGRPMMVYRLSKQLNTIIDAIQEEKEQETEYQLARIRKLRAYVDKGA